jgi:hypothetical protein
LFEQTNYRQKTNVKKNLFQIEAKLIFQNIGVKEI